MTMSTADRISHAVEQLGETDINSIAMFLSKSTATVRNHLNKGVNGVSVTKQGKKTLVKPTNNVSGKSKASGASTTSNIHTSKATNNSSTKLDRQTVKNMSSDMERELEAVAKKYGVQIDMGGGTYDPDGNFANFKVKVSTLSEDGTAQTKEAEDFKRRAAMYGLSADMLGKSFELRGEMFTVTGLAAKAKKYPVLIKNSQGKDYKVSAQVVKSRLG